MIADAAPPDVRARHHIAAMRDHESKLRLDSPWPEDVEWRRRRIEGHAVRAVVAMLEALR